MASKKLAFLVIEDDESIQFLINELIKSKFDSPSIHNATKINEIPLILRKNNIDLIISDRQIINGNAWDELLKPNYKSFKKIFISGTPDVILPPSDIPYFSKPFCFTELGVCIDEMLSKKRRPSL